MPDITPELTEMRPGMAKRKKPTEGITDDCRRADCRRTIRKFKRVREVPESDRPMMRRILKELAKEFANPSPRWVEFDELGKVLRVGYS